MPAYFFPGSLATDNFSKRIPKHGHLSLPLLRRILSYITNHTGGKG